ncbi:hypothetical protein [uncultured Ruthenibacterium sp.]|uniref:hypothetical protein n=1 Tax=uncultured Ruthenibacterium sp. TaxID=1905347 RepID=UPI00349EA6BC
MKQTILENRKLAAVVLCITVVVSLLGIGSMKVRSVGNAPLEYYNSNMAADFAARETAAGSLIALAEESGVDDGLVQRAQAALDASCEADEPSARYSAGVTMKTAVELMYNAMPSDERDKTGSPAQMAWSEFTSRTAILSHAVPEYNELARQAAGKLSGFPASVLAKVVGVSPEEMVA